MEIESGACAAQHTHATRRSIDCMTEQQVSKFNRYKKIGR
jgi:hypothetical protein